MEQSFEVKGGPQIGRQNLPLLRAELARQGLDGFYVPHEDEYQNEYLPDANERLAWATGFTGSFGSALILETRAAIFIDGRYTIQAEDQTDNDLFERVHVPDPGPFGWIGQQTLTGLTLGYDPALMTPNDVDRLNVAATKAGATIRAVADNPIDLAWQDRPPQPAAPVIPHALRFTGQKSSDKRAALAAGLRRDGADAVILTSPASLAWLFNIRGGDVACSPLPLGRAIVNADGHATLFLSPEKETPDLRDHLGPEVTLAPPEALEDAIDSLNTQVVSLDPASASAWFF
ncbi:MAG: aminopeptidase P family N-terminal domain-containing protein, partial [Pseudomonadota bacterium]